VKPELIPRTTPVEPPGPRSSIPAQNLLNRELSWLEFNRRVLAMAQDEIAPLLERVRFLAIFCSNLDEFFMKRVGGLKRQVAAHAMPSGAEHASPSEQLKEIRRTLLPMLELQNGCFRDLLEPALRKKGVKLLAEAELTSEEREFAREFFFRNIFPVLTPLYVDPGHPFPFISNLSTSFGVLMRRPGVIDEELFARVKVPSVFPAWITLPGSGESGVYRLVSLHSVMESHLGALFPGMEIIDVMAFRITRNADLERDEVDAEDLLIMVTEELRERRFARVVRLEHGPDPHPRILKILLEELEVGERDVYQSQLSLEYLALLPLADLNLPKLKYPSWLPVAPMQLSDPESNIFDVIAAGDLLVHHPYESFSASVERFIRQAVDDPKVLAIKMTLYRTGDESPFIPLLIRAAESGKQVVCLVELKAHFDEARNILVAQALEKAGVHVVYGLLGLKTHCKISLVVRKEKQGVRSYAHIGTGNYHARTARLYTDLGLFTAKRELTDDVVHLFHYLTGLSLEWKFKKLVVAPFNLRAHFLALIEREIEYARAGREARIIAKMNSLQDEQTCMKLYEASKAGVKIELIVRGLCCLRPQVAGLSENIRVVSIVGRFLEHSRIFYFRGGAELELEGQYYIGSADWMERNLNDRVEAVVPIEDLSLKRKCWSILTTQLQDAQQAWEMNPDGTYLRRQEQAPAVETDLGGTPGSQGLLMRQTFREQRLTG
jgi:polyphosphate kinase